MKISRNTTAKTEIQHLISKSEVALSHLEIQKAVGELCDRVTIYRVLERLVADEVIHRIVNVDGVVKFASCKKCVHHHKHNHIHFSCEKCKAVSCLDEIIPTFVMPKNYKINQLNFMVSGLCPLCM